MRAKREAKQACAHLITHCHMPMTEPEVMTSREPGVRRADHGV
jgi:hypothetical protein